MSCTVEPHIRSYFLFSSTAPNLIHIFSHVCILHNYTQLCILHNYHVCILHNYLTTTLEFTFKWSLTPRSSFSPEYLYSYNPQSAPHVHINLHIWTSTYTCSHLIYSHLIVHPAWATFTSWSPHILLMNLHSLDPHWFPCSLITSAIWGFNPSTCHVFRTWVYALSPSLFNSYFTSNGNIKAVVENLDLPRLVPVSSD